VQAAKRLRAQTSLRDPLHLHGESERLQPTAVRGTGSRVARTGCAIVQLSARCRELRCVLWVRAVLEPYLHLRETKHEAKKWMCVCVCVCVCVYEGMTDINERINTLTNEKRLLEHLAYIRG
jgi:hypothetical protein